MMTMMMMIKVASQEAIAISQTMRKAIMQLIWILI
jgi:hypothetical protein